MYNTYIRESNNYIYKNRRFCVEFGYPDIFEKILSIQKKNNNIIISVKKRNKAITSRYVHFARKEMMLFSNIFPNADAEFSVDDKGINEKLIISRPSNKYSFTYIIECPNMKWLYCSEENKIIFFDETTETEVFCIPMTYIIDSKGILSVGVVYKIKRINEHKFQLTLKANEGWLNIPEREFPVRLEHQILVR